MYTHTRIYVYMQASVNQHMSQLGDTRAPCSSPIRAGIFSRASEWQGLATRLADMIGTVASIKCHRLDAVYILDCSARKRHESEKAHTPSRLEVKFGSRGSEEALCWRGLFAAPFPCAALARLSS